jgi:hypothetical protein
VRKVLKVFEEEKQEAIKEAVEKAMKEKDKEFARAIINLLPIDIVSQKTGLTVNEIEQLKNEREEKE